MADYATSYSLPHQEELTPIVDGMIRHGINFVALDFDQTLISVHTRGQWELTTADLLPHVRPILQTFLMLALAKNLHVAMVTFSPQTTLVAEILDLILPHEFASRISIRGEDLRWDYRGLGSREGKQKHMASAAEHLQSKYDVTITRATSLLIDDETENIRIALSEGVRAVRFDPIQSELFLNAMTQLFPLY